jgi:hypothetical protein
VGPAHKAEYKVNIPSTICDWYVNEIVKANITKVSYKRDNNFNLFAISQYMIDGWVLSRDADHIAVSKNDISIKFDIVICTR